MARARTRPLARPRSVLIVGSEARPFAKTGGLADVLGALPSALARLGWDATLVIPRYRGVAVGTRVDAFPVTIGGLTLDLSVHETPLSDGARALLVGCPELYDRDALYGSDEADYPDNARRFAVLSRAALEWAARRAVPISVVHAHDWQAGLAPVYLRTLYRSHPVLAGTPSVFTIHNLAYQGVFESDWLPRLDLGWNLFTIDQLEYWGRISFLKGGINDADLITTVSPRYAEEIQTPEFGCGFDGILRRRRDDLVGVLNGIDTREWDPASDPFLPKPFNAADLEGKAAAKAAVLARFGLPAEDGRHGRALVGMISRMVDQKGLDLLFALADELPTLDATFVVLGTGEARYQDFWTKLAAAHPDRVGVHVGFDEPLAHLIEAGADLFLMPSRFEPCGLNQMYSLRYGTVPIVREVGGLADTVRDYALPSSGAGAASRSGAGAPSRTGAGAHASGAAALPPSGASVPRRRASTGFVFQDYTPAALLDVLGRALRLYAEPRKWLALQRAGMRQDFSWDRSAQEYGKIYERAIKKRVVAGG